MICPHCHQETESEWLDVSDVLPGMEVEIAVHDKDKSWKELGLIHGDNRLLTYDQCIKLANSKYASRLKMDGSSYRDDFFIQQPFELNKKNGYIARFDADSDRAGLDCNRNPSDTYATLGVRLIRKKSEKVKS